MAVKISSSLIRNFPVFCRLLARMFSSSSESESVLMCRCASASRNWRRAGVLIKLPFYRQPGTKAGLLTTHVGEDNPVRRVDVERLRLGMSGASGGGVSDLNMSFGNFMQVA